MSRFVISTDSGCDLPASLLAEREIVACPISYVQDGETIRDSMCHEDCHAFYEQMRAGKTPKTSQLNAFEIYEFWKSLMPSGIVHISLGSGISGTYANCVTALDMLRSDYPDACVRVVDSTLASVGYGMLALRAADARDNGATLDECADEIEKIKPRINTWYTTNDLTYLYRSGRVSRMGAVVGTALHINPILNLDDLGHLIVRERVRGRKAAIRSIHQAIGQLAENPGEQTLFICHSDIPEEAREFGEGIREEFGFRDVYYTYIGPSIGSHCGPGLMAAFFEGKPRTR